MKNKFFAMLQFFIITFWFSVNGASVPDKTVVLTFDDAVRSHLTVVAPLLKEYGFGATFFISKAWMTDAEHFLTWTEVAVLHNMGFEIGNHSWSHMGFYSPAAAALLAGELALVEYKLKEVGVPKPVSFGWTGNFFCPEAREVLEKAGYKFARRGMQPEVSYGLKQPGPLFDPENNHRLLIPSAGDGYPEWTLDHFKKVVDRAKNGKIAVIQFHGIPDIVHPWVHTPPERFKEYMSYLKENDFNVVSLKDIGTFIPEDKLINDPMSKERYGPLKMPTEVNQTRKKLDFWMENMILHHRYNLEEAAGVCGLRLSEVENIIDDFDLKNPVISNRSDDGKIKILPYPGGRHPRIGSLNSAISPQRGTKVSIFTPWNNGGYVVLDLPEAIFSNLGLTFLAHTHIPTIWNDQNKNIENVDWILREDGKLSMERLLPNGIKFGAIVEPRKDSVYLELWLDNDSDINLTGLRAQICLLLKGAPGFNEQTEKRNIYKAPVTAVKSSEKNRWILVAFENCGRTWGNPNCPCIHSDPVLQEAAVKKRVSVKGGVWFYEGDDLYAEISRIESVLVQ